jgi:hypothetical protein
LEAALVAQGLYAKEAHAMLETWQDSWFEEGSRLIYVLPSRTIDNVLPLDIQPAPQQVHRVFVGRIELISDETKQAVETALAQREWSTLDRYQRFLRPILSSIGAGSSAKASPARQTAEAYLSSRACE